MARFGERLLPFMCPCCKYLGQQQVGLTVVWAGFHTHLEAHFFTRATTLRIAPRHDRNELTIVSFSVYYNVWYCN